MPRLSAGVTLDKQKFDRRNLLKANRAALIPQPGSGARSKLLLVKPTNKSARRVISIKTEELIKKQEGPEKTPLQESRKDKSDLPAEDVLSREDMLRNSEALSKRERRQIRFRNKILKERRRLYRRDPSSQRTVDFDLDRSWLSRFKKQLDANQEGREPTNRARGGSDDTLSPSFDTGRDGGNDVHAKMDSTLEEVGPAKAGSSDGANDAPQSSNSKEDDERAIPSMDGAFDDHIRAQTKKRKLVNGPADLVSEKEQRKKVKKEKKAKKELARKDKLQGATSASETQSSQLNASIRDQDTDSTKENTAFDSMSQPKKPEVKVEDQNTTSNEFRVKRAETQSNTAKRRVVNRNETIGDKANKAQDNGAKADVPPTNSITTNVAKTSASKPDTNIGLAAQPWYKIHARLIMEPDFDDLVYERRRKPKYKPANNRYNSYLVSGAILDHSEYEEAVSGALPSPPLTSPPSSDRMEKVDKLREERGAKKQVEKYGAVKNKKHAAKSRSRSHSSPVSAGEP